MRADRASPAPHRLIVAIAAAEGAEHAVRLLAALRARGVESHLVVGEDVRPAVEALAGRPLAELADHVHQPWNQAARISSGSFPVDGMVVAPCPPATAATIAHGVGPDLIYRAADVTIKEGRPLALLVPEGRSSPITAEAIERLAAIPGVRVVRPAPGDPDRTVGLLLAGVLPPGGP